MPLQQGLTDAHGIPVGQAYGVITDWNLQGAKNIGVVWLSWYASKAAHDQGFPPFQVDEITLTLAEQQGGIAQLIGVLYGIVQARPAYSAVSNV